MAIQCHITNLVQIYFKSFYFESCWSFQTFTGRGRVARRPPRGWDTARPTGRWWWATARRQSPCTAAPNQSEHRMRRKECQKSEKKKTF